MQYKAVSFLKRNLGNLIMIALFSVLFLHPDGRPWLMRQLFRVGLFQPSLPAAKIPDAGKPVQLSFLDSSGAALHTGQWAGKVVLINYWATWCPPCRAEMPSLEQLYQSLRTDPRFVFLLADADGQFKESARYLQQQGITLPLVAPVAPVDQMVFSGTLPTTVVLDTRGRLVWKKEGLANYNSETFRKQLLHLADEGQRLSANP